MKILVLVWCLQISFVYDLSFCILTVFRILCLISDLVSTPQLNENMSNVYMLYVCEFS